MLIEDEKLREKKVITADGRHIGDVTGIEIDTESWKVQWLDVKLLRDILDGLKVKKPMFGTITARFSPDRVKTVTDTVLLAIDFTQVSALLHPDSKDDGVAKKG